MPYDCAALQMFSAFEPSRLTPQLARTCSSGTQRSWYASIMPRQAAPHSVASICMTTGTLRTSFCGMCATYSFPITMYIGRVSRTVMLTGTTPASPAAVRIVKSVRCGSSSVSMVTM